MLDRIRVLSPLDDLAVARDVILGLVVVDDRGMDDPGFDDNGSASPSSSASALGPPRLQRALL